MVPMVVSQKIAQEKHRIYNGLIYIYIRDSAPGHHSEVTARPVVPFRAFKCYLVTES